MTNTNKSIELINGWTATKVVTGYCYPRNGNLDNPTERVLWKMEDERGRMVGTVSTLRDAREWARETMLDIPSDQLGTER